jgi:hypothetical protein
MVMGKVIEPPRQKGYNPTVLDVGLGGVQHGRKLANGEDQCGKLFWKLETMPT